jgi:membrane protein
VAKAKQDEQTTTRRGRVKALFLQTGRDLAADKAPTYAAALSYHMLLALAPMVVIAVGVLDIVYGDNTEAVDSLVTLTEQHLGAPAADAVQLVLGNMSAHPGTNVAVMVVSAAVTLFLASSAFRQLRKALDAIWHVQPARAESVKRTLWVYALGQLVLFALVLSLGLVLVVVVALSSLWGRISESLRGTLRHPEALLRSGDFVVTLALVTVVFVVLYRAVPLARLPRRDLWLAAALAAFLFDIGRLLFGIYMQHSSTASLYGAAGTLVIFLVWVYYSANILYFGAALARVHARRRGERVLARPGARVVE